MVKFGLTRSPWYLKQWLKSFTIQTSQAVDVPLVPVEMCDRRDMNAVLDDTCHSEFGRKDHKSVRGGRMGRGLEGVGGIWRFGDLGVRRDLCSTCLVSRFWFRDFIPLLATT